MNTQQQRTEQGWAAGCRRLRDAAPELAWLALPTILMVLGVALALTGCAGQSPAPIIVEVTRTVQPSPTTSAPVVTTEDIDTVWEQTPSTYRAAACTHRSDYGTALTSALARQTGLYASDPQIRDAVQFMVTSKCAQVTP